MVACSIAKGYGVQTIARINSPDYIDRPVSTDRLKMLGIDVAICPDLVAAHKIVRILMEPPALLESDVFAKGRLKVVQVTPGGAAARAGVRVGDVVVEAAGQRVASMESFRLALAQRAAGARVALEVERSGKPHRVVLALP